MLERGYFTADSLNFLFVILEDISTDFLLAILNSAISEWRFRLTSTNNHVNAYEIERLPVPRITVATPDPERVQVVDKATGLYESGEYSAVTLWTNDELGWTPEAGLAGTGRSDTVHDLLSQLAKRMMSLQGERKKLEQRWREWVEATVPRADKLKEEFLEQGWGKVGLRDGWDGVKAVFQARGAIPSAKELQELRRETEHALRELKPLYKRIEATDHLIDQIVYRLYGLTEEEISVVEVSVRGV